MDAKLQAAYGRAHAGRPNASLPARLFAAIADLTGLARTGPLALVLRKEAAARRWLRLYTDALSTLQSLSQVCRLGIISNAWPQLESFLDLLGIGHYFESVTISAQVGLSKPDPAIYHLALQTLHVNAKQAIFVDDRPANVVAAERMGFLALWLVRVPAAANIQTAYRNLTQIHSLEQLIPLLQQA